MVMSTGPGGLNLSALAGAAGAETSRRVDAGQQFLSSALASMLQENQGRLASQSEQQVREQNFMRAQALLDEALARRQAALANGGGGGGGGSRDPALDLQMELMLEDFKAERDIQKSIRLMEYEDRIANRRSTRKAKAEAKANTFTSKDFGSNVIHPERGEALVREQGRPRLKGGLRGALTSYRKYADQALSKDQRDRLQNLVGDYGSDFPSLVAAIRREKDLFGGSLGARRASIGLYEMGYGLQ